MREHNLQNVSFPDPPETFHARVCRTLADLPERKEARHMKKSVKILLTAAAVLALLATAAFAVGQLADISSRTAAGTLTELPSAGDAAQRLGVPVKLPADFANGYAFEQANYVNNQEHDETGTVGRTWVSLSVQYGLNGSAVELNADSRTDLVGSDPKAERCERDGTALYYTAYTLKCVPEDYRMTAQDRQDEADGVCEFSWGADETSVSQVQSVSWADGGTAYVLTAIDAPLGRADLLGMAEQCLQR
jgi:hypothetical protein